jgi:hypothetical protein
VPDCPLLDACIPAEPLPSEYGLCMSFTNSKQVPISEFSIQATTFKICGSSIGCITITNTYTISGGSLPTQNYTVIGTTITSVVLDGPPASWGLQFYGYLGLQLESLILRNIPLPLPFTTLALFPKLTTLEISSTAITALDISPLHYLTSLNLANCRLSQSAANTIASSLVGSGISGGTLTIQTQATGSLTITGDSWDILLSRGWTLA